MNRPQVFKSRDKALRVFKVAIILAVVFSILFFVSRPYHQLLYDAEALRSFIQSFGAFGPLVVVLAQVSQVLIAPVPGPVVGAAAGYAFGVFWGTIWGLIGLSLGSAIAILLSKTYGRPFVEDVLADETMDKFDGLASEHGFLPFFLLFLLPGFPDDAICFIAGLTELDTKKLILFATFGRLPGLLSLTVAGNSLAESNYFVFVLIGVIVILVSAVAWYAREKVIKPGEEVKNPFESIRGKLSH